MPSTKANLHRRGFLTGAAGAAGTATLLSANGAAAKPLPLPSVSLGDKKVSRLIAGGNPMRGFSHSSKKLSQHMMQYFTAERITSFLLHCEANGIDTFQTSFSDTVRDGILGARERGGKTQVIWLDSARRTPLDTLLALDPIAIVNHGGDTDRSFREGKQEQIRDYIAKVHDAGILAGVSTHKPDHVAHIEDAGWENDFYMTCFYHLSRTQDECDAITGERVLGELFLAKDPERMTARIREVSKPCLGFKILGSGRLSENPKSLDAAFRYAFANIKPGDGVIVGMYPVFSDEIKEDAELARTYALPS